MGRRLQYESDVERFLCQRVREAGGLCIKLGYNGLPDRIVMLPHGRVEFVELKRPGGTLTEEQQLWLNRISRLGITALCVKSREEVEQRYGKWSK